MNAANSHPTTLERAPSGIPGLDTLLLGGFLRGGVYMVLGRPGAGKTILGGQICFNQVAAGRPAIFLTLLTESHSRLLAHLRGFEFFRADEVGRSLSFVRNIRCNAKCCHWRSTTGTYVRLSSPRALRARIVSS